MSRTSSQMIDTTVSARSNRAVSRRRAGWTFIAPLSALAAMLAAPLTIASAQDRPAAPERPAPKTTQATPGTGAAKPTRPASGGDGSNLATNRRPPTTSQTAPSRNEVINPAGARGTAGTAPAQQVPAEKPVIRFEPEVLDFGDMVAGVAMTLKVKVINISDEPVTMTKLVPGCGCTSTNWTKDPIAPGGAGEADITLKPGDKQGIDLHKKVTFQLDGHPPMILDLKGHVAEFIRVSPEMIDAPAEDESKDGQITLTSVDGTPFKIVSVNPPIVKDPGTESKTEHVVEIDWKAWADSGKGSKLSFTTDHPKGTTLMTIVKRSVRDLRTPTPPPPTRVDRAPSMTPLIQAVRAGDATAVKLQIANGADVNGADAVGGGRTALHWAVKEGKKDLIPLLLEAKANVDATDRVGKTPLSVAAEGRDLEIVTMLVNAGADVNARDQIGGSSLLWASGLGSPEIVKFLLSKGAEVNVIDLNGLSPLLWAAGIGGDETVSALVAAGAKVDLADKISGDTALMRAARTGKFESVEILVKAKAPINARNTVGMTPFMLAAASGSVEKLQLLKDAGADTEAKDVKGWNALDHAKNRIDADRAKVVEYLAAFVPASGATTQPQVGQSTPAATAAAPVTPTPSTRPTGPTGEQPQQPSRQ